MPTRDFAVEFGPVVGEPEGTDSGVAEIGAELLADADPVAAGGPEPGWSERGNSHATSPTSKLRTVANSATSVSRRVVVRRLPELLRTSPPEAGGRFESMVTRRIMHAPGGAGTPTDLISRTADSAETESS
ncbi:hypothetical protein [Cryptosporangium phraense]|uniref:Uncharacterized protein n=1 Tax=Cryptosporangium phraense TaxID=2593070 RepID=A0A545AWE8_9ACTN|nr:hypothetical protein [Cryptosporangium phraense]TQS45648.1 hypothetical protein FL583_07945 [Cryptosporangium phraense]